MEKLVSAALEFLKLSPRYLAALAGVAALLLFGPEGALKRLGLLDFQQHYRDRVALVLLLSGGLLVIDGGVHVVRRVGDAMQRRKVAQFRLQRLRSLTESEKQILRFYIGQQTRTNVLRIDDGVVQGLVGAGILYPAAQMGSLLHGLAHNIHQLAWEYLNEHPSLLDGTTKLARTDAPRGRWP